MNAKLNADILALDHLCNNAHHHVNKVVKLATDLTKNLVENFNAKFIMFRGEADQAGFDNLLPILDPKTNKCISFKVVLKGGEYRTKLPVELSLLDLRNICNELVGINTCMEDGVKSDSVRA